jgi:SAM-dependent MidA family methyltransferase
MSDTLLKISRTLQHRMIEEIKRSGAISFSRFMSMALYEPGLGYYSAGLHKLGAEGDFITASGLGALFAKTHAKVFAPLLAELTEPCVLELGAGTGEFCCDLLQALDQLQALPVRYQIVEVSADLKQVQQQQVSQLPQHLQQRVEWLAAPPDQAYEGIVFANEVIDALPVEVFQCREQQVQRLMLQHQSEQGFVEHWQPFPAAMQQQFEQLQLNLPEGYRSEFLPNLAAWLESVTSQLKKGWVFLIDYGYGRDLYYHPQRNTGTLVCQRRHQAHFDPYQDIGLQDITAFVDFTAVAEALEGLGFELLGFTTQGDYLVDAGIQELLDPDDDYQSYYRLVSEMKQLVLPEEMGEKFKVMVAGKNTHTPVSGLNHSRWQDL